MSWIDPFQSGWLDWVQEQSKADAGTYSLLLLDGAFLHGLYPRLVQNGSTQRACCALFEGLAGSNDAALAVSPVVIEYRATDTTLHDVLCAADRRPMVTLINTVETAEQLAARLARWCVVDADGSFFNFRFPDTRRLPAIARTLTDAQRAQMLGSAHEWQCVNRFGRWEQLPISAGAVASEEAPKLTATQFAALVKDSEADEILALLEPEFADSVRRALPSWRFVRAQHALTMANRLGIDNMQERIASVALSLVCDGQQLEQRLGERGAETVPPSTVPLVPR